MKPYLSLFGLICLVSALAGCLGSVAPGGAAQGRSCQQGICVKLKLSEPIQPNVPVLLTLTATADHDAPATQLGIAFSIENVVSIEGERKWTVNLQANTPLKRETTLRFPGPGYYRIEANALSREGAHVSDSVTVQLTDSGHILNPTADPNKTETVVPLTPQSERLRFALLM